MLKLKVPDFLRALILPMVRLFGRCLVLFLLLWLICDNLPAEGQVFFLDRFIIVADILVK